jgi:hypothetical protein
MRSPSDIEVPGTRLLLCQRHVFSAFSFDFFQNDQLVGGFDFAFWSQAQNARIKIYDQDSRSGDVQVSLCGERLRMTHTYTKRAFNNDVLYQLVEDESGVEVARIELTRVDGQRWPRLLYSLPDTDPMTLGILGNLFRREFLLKRRSGEQCVARICDVSKFFSPRRKVLVESDDLSPRQLALLGVFVTFFRP